LFVDFKYNLRFSSDWVASGSSKFALEIDYPGSMSGDSRSYYSLSKIGDNPIETEAEKNNDYD